MNDAAGRRPTVVTICGSTKFKRQMLDAARQMTLEGKIVLTPFVFVHAEALTISDQDKAGLDELHWRKIDMSDEVHIVNPYGEPLGESTKKEVDYAHQEGKEITYSDEILRPTNLSLAQEAFAEVPELRNPKSAIRRVIMRLCERLGRRDHRIEDLEADLKECLETDFRRPDF